LSLDPRLKTGVCARLCIKLVHVDDDSLKGLREAVGDAFEGKSVGGLGDEAEELAQKEAEDGLRRD
jgi:hypothetical protein